MPKPSKRQIIILSAAVVLGAAVWALFFRSDNEAVELRTAVATVKNLETTVTAVGKVQPHDYVDVGAQVSGQLVQIAVEVGDQVEEGQLLAVIDPSLLQAQVEAGEAQIRELQASVVQQRAEYELAQAEADRNRLLRSKDAISEQDVQTSDAALKVAAARIQQLEAQIDRITSTLKGDQAKLDYTQAYAPISGTVVSIAATQGQTLNANQSTPVIMRVADLSLMTVEADVSEADVSRLKPGMEAYFTTLGRPDDRYRSSLRQILPQPEIVNDVVLYKALLDVANEGFLLPEMSAQVFFVVGRAEDAITVPVAALREGRRRQAGSRNNTDGDRPQSARRGQGGPERRPEMQALREAQLAHEDSTIRMVLLKGKDGETKPRPVVVGLQTRSDAEIIAGLEAGDEVVIGEVERVAAPTRGGRGMGRAMGRGR